LSAIFLNEILKDSGDIHAAFQHSFTRKINENNGGRNYLLDLPFFKR
jgi:hypothetical protein